jgi:hypothetical protein
VPKPFVLSLALTGLLLLPACSDEPDEVATDDCGPVEAASAPPEAGELIDLADTVTFVRYDVSGDVTTAEGVSSEKIPDVLDTAAEAFEAAGWTIGMVEDEGDDAEVFANGPEGELGIVALRTSSCPDEVLVTMTIDRGEPASPETQA